MGNLCEKAIFKLLEIRSKNENSSRINNPIFPIVSLSKPARVLLVVSVSIVRRDNNHVIGIEPNLPKTKKTA